MSESIYHFLPKADYERALATGRHEPESLVTEGFIHCSKREQVIHVANFIVPGRRDLVLLEIDPVKVSHPIRHENLEGGEMQYPHIYGALDLGAVERVLEFQPDGAGVFQDKSVNWP